MMKWTKCLAASAMLSSVVVFSVAPSQAQQTSVTLMSYNIHCGVPMGSDIGKFLVTPEVMDTLAETIGESDPDIVALQEVDSHFGYTQPKERQRSSLINQARYLAARGNYHYLYNSTINDHKSPRENRDYQEWGTADQWTNNGAVHGESGRAVLSRWGFVGDSINVHLPRIKETESPRAYSRSEIGVPGADGTTRTIILYATHLQHDSADSRWLQMGAILDAIEKEDKNVPVFLMGDLNHRPFVEGEKRNPIQEAIRRGMHDLAGPAEGEKEEDWLTFNSEKPRSRIDYIMCTHPVKVLSKQVVKSKASDHMPVVVSVELP